MPTASGVTYFEFVHTPTFVESAAGVLGDAELRAIEQALIANPEAGRRIEGTGGFRKVRVALPAKGRGKSGGARVAYFYAPAVERIYLGYAFSKGESEDLSPAGKRMLRDIAKDLKQEW